MAYGYSAESVHWSTAIVKEWAGSAKKRSQIDLLKVGLEQLGALKAFDAHHLRVLQVVENLQVETVQLKKQYAKVHGPSF